MTIAYCLFREGFLKSGGESKKVATLLGVGGSVMTVPLMRRAGLSMAQASALRTP